MTIYYFKFSHPLVVKVMSGIFPKQLTCPILKFTSNLKPQAGKYFSSLSYNRFVLHYNRACYTLSEWSVNLSQSNFGKNRKNMFEYNKYLQYHTICCSLPYRINFPFCGRHDNSCGDYNLLNQNVILNCTIAKNYGFVLSHKYSMNNKRLNGIMNPKHQVLKNKESIQQVLDDKHKKIRQTQQRLKKSGKLILDDIKETKSKMKEKMEEIIERENIWTIPNILCVARIAVSPYIGYVIMNCDYNLALYLVIFAGITDLLDGIIARNFQNQSSKLGSFLDPMADKVLIATLFLTLTISGSIPVPLTALIISRDVILFSSGFYIRYHSLPPPRTLSRYFDMTHATAQLAPTMISKVNTSIQLVTVFSTLAAAAFGFNDHPALHCLWYLTGGTTIASALSYLTQKDTYKLLKKRKA